MWDSQDKDFYTEESNYKGSNFQRYNSIFHPRGSVREQQTKNKPDDEEKLTQYEIFIFYISIA